MINHRTDKIVKKEDLVDNFKTDHNDFKNFLDNCEKKITRATSFNEAKSLQNYNNTVKNNHNNHNPPEQNLKIVDRRNLNKYLMQAKESSNTLKFRLKTENEIIKETKVKDRVATARPLSAYKNFSKKGKSDKLAYNYTLFGFFQFLRFTYNNLITLITLFNQLLFRTN